MKYDGTLDIAVAKSRKQTSWKNKKVTWSELVAKLTVTHRTAEKYADYMAFKRDRQDEIKDVGGFVGGYLTGGKRKNGSVAHRSLVTLDIDKGTPDTWEDFLLVYGCAACCYTTHKHSSKAPRYRIIIPLDREIFADEYEPICRRIAEGIGIEAFTDTTTYEPTRLMYWPSTSKDGEFFSDVQDGPPLCADEILATYRDWKDSSSWPTCTAERDKVKRDIKKQEDPLEKPGIIGAFCRTYTITDAIEQFLGDFYEPTNDADRFTYIHGSTAGGLVVYEDKFAFSHHGSDPTSGQLCNAFDLVRIHKYGLRDEDTPAGTPTNKLPSFAAMSTFASGLDGVRQLAAQERLAAAKYEFLNTEDDEAPEAEDSEAGDEWLKDLKLDAKGKTLQVTENVILILENDRHLKGRFALNDFEKREEIRGGLPWRKLTKEKRYMMDSDDANLRNYLESVYQINSAAKIKDALDIVIARHSFHPVKDYLKGAVWDGVERVDTLLIDYLGAEDNQYTRVVTRKTLVAGVARIFTPGIKFDTVLSLAGEEGKGKSELIARLGGPWFSDSFSFHMLNSKEANEQVQGSWLIEIAEMSGLSNAETEASKSFISRQEDRYRVAYGKRLSYFPRQCIFIGTSNRDDFLKSVYGNRRFWPVKTLISEPTKSVFDLSPAEVRQIWAEALQLHNEGEPLHLSAEMQEEAKHVQRRFTETDDREGMIYAFLNKKLPEDWETMDISERRSYLQGGDGLIEVAEGTVRRTRVCAAEIWVELFNGNAGNMATHNTKFIHAALLKAPGWHRAGGNLMFTWYGKQRGYYRI